MYLTVKLPATQINEISYSRILTTSYCNSADINSQTKNIT